MGLRLMRVQGEARACCAEARRAPTVRVHCSDLVLFFEVVGSDKVSGRVSTNQFLLLPKDIFWQFNTMDFILVPCFPRVDAFF